MTWMIGRRFYVCVGSMRSAAALTACLTLSLGAGSPRASAAGLDDFFRERTALVSQGRSDSAFLERQEKNQLESFNRDVFYRKIEGLEKEIDLDNQRLAEEREKEAKKEGEKEEFKESAADRFLAPESSGENPYFFTVDLPVYESSFNYDSNLFLDRKKPQDDWSRDFALTVPVYAGLGEWKYQSQVRGNYSSFEQFPENDTGAVRWVQLLKLEGKRLKIEFENGLGQSFHSDLTDTRGTRADVFETRLAYRLTPKTTWTADYEHAQTFKLDPGRGGRMLHRASTGFSYQWTAKTRLGLGYSHIWEQDKNLSKEFDANRHRIFASLFHNNHSKLSFNVLGGLTLRDFDQPSTNTVGLKTDWDLFGAALYDWTPKVRLNLGLGRGASSDQEMPQADDPVRYTLRSGVAYRVAKAWSVKGVYALTLDKDRRIRTVEDPDHPEITTTKFDEVVLQSGNLSLYYNPLQNLTFIIDYGLSQRFNELQDKEYVRQKISYYFTYAF